MWPLLRLPVRRRRRRWWFWPIAVFVQVLLLAVLILVWVLGTESGLRSVLALADDLAPGVVQVGQVQGRLAGDLHLTGLAVRLPDLELSAAELTLRLAPLGGSVRDPAHRVPDRPGAEHRHCTKPAGPAKPLTLPTVVLPLGIEIDEALIEGLSISELRDDPPPPFVIDRIALAAGLSSRAGWSCASWP